MPEPIRLLITLTACLSAVVWHTAMAQIAAPQIGIVVMHGKGGSPNTLVAPLASGLAEDGFLVANQEMPWSGRRQYNATVSEAEKELEAAIAALRDKGAQKIFVAGHSQGGVFALHAGSKLSIDGVIAIAPGGDVSSQLFKEKLGSYVDKARGLVTEGKGDEKTQLADYDGPKGPEPLFTTPRIYMTWFDPDGAMNQKNALKASRVPVLYVAPGYDYPGLLRIKMAMFNSLPAHPLNKLHEPAATHTGAPAASRAEVARWVLEVANAKKP
jgi:pimeloyl-ACP methyl ester carboxylesterase